MRALAIFFLIIALAALGWDANNILTGYGVASLSGIAHIWQSLDKTSYDVIEQIALGSAGHGVWTYFALPVMTLPACALFGITGLVMLRGQNHEIKVRAPSERELELVRQGMDPRRSRR